MSQIIVLAFEEDKDFNPEAALQGPTKADDFLETVLAWQEKGIVEIEDAVVAARGMSGNLQVKQTKSLAGKYALRGSGVGLLAGLLLGGPIGGLVAGATIGAVGGKMKDIGIDDKFIKQVSQGLAPNTSALFLMGTAKDRDKFLEEIKPFKALVAYTTLEAEAEKALQQALDKEG